MHAARHRRLDPRAAGRRRRRGRRWRCSSRLAGHRRRCAAPNRCCAGRSSAAATSCCSCRWTRTSGAASRRSSTSPAIAPATRVGAGIVQLLLFTGAGVAHRQPARRRAAWSRPRRSGSDDGSIRCTCGVVEAAAPPASRRAAGQPRVRGRLDDPAASDACRPERRPRRGRHAAGIAPPGAGARARRQLELLADLRSGDAARVSAALVAPPTRSIAIHVAQIIDLLAWDDVLRGRARRRSSSWPTAHSGMLIDALLDAADRFRHPPPPAAHPRRPAPHAARSTAWCTASTIRASRCAITAAGPSIGSWRTNAAPARSTARASSRSIERELSVPPQVWHGYRLLDRPELETAATSRNQPRMHVERSLEHIFSLLSTIVAARAARRRGAAASGRRTPGVQRPGDRVSRSGAAARPSLGRGCAAMMAATPSAAGAPSQSGSPPPATPPSAPR